MFEIGTASDYRDLLAKLNAFLTGSGVAYGLTYVGTGNGSMTGYRGGPDTAIAEAWTIVATDATHFTVMGAVHGEYAYAIVGTPFTSGELAFTITAGSTPFVAGDTFTLNTTPYWTPLRQEPGAVISCSGGTGGTSGQYSYENLIDGKWGTDTSRYWDGGSQPTAGTPKAVQFDFPAARTVREYQIQGYSSTGYNPKTWTFDYWNGSAWVTLDTQTNVSFAAAELKTFAIASPASATRYRLNFTDATYTFSSWRINRVALHETVGGIDIACSQYVWQAPNNDATGGAIAGLRAFCRTDVSYWNWELFTADAFDTTRAMYDQQNVQRNMYLALSNSSIPYWFVADGRRVVVVAKVGTNYETMYLGFIEPFFTPSQYPYPAAMGCSLNVAQSTPRTWESAYYQSSTNNTRHTAFTHSDSWLGETSGCGCLRVRRLDGSWLEFFSRYNGSKGAPASGWVWPWCLGATAVDPNLDGSYTLFPVMLLEGTPNALGQLSGISFVTGQGVTPEDTVTIGPVKHLVVPNINRSTREDFLALRLD